MYTSILRPAGRCTSARPRYSSVVTPYNYTGQRYKPAYTRYTFTRQLYKPAFD